MIHVYAECMGYLMDERRQPGKADAARPEITSCPDKIARDEPIRNVIARIANPESARKRAA